MPIKEKLDIFHGETFVETSLKSTNISLFIFFKKVVLFLFPNNFVKLLASYLDPLILIDLLKLILNSLLRSLLMKVLLKYYQNLPIYYFV